MKFILGTKIGMSQVFDKEGKVIPVTLIEAGPCIVTQIKTEDREDGYDAVQVGFKKIEKPKKIKKTMKGKEFKHIREYKIQDTRPTSPASELAGGRSKYKIQDIKLGDKIDVSIFQEGDIVKVSGISKGKGFQGVVKRWGFAGRGASHGVKHEARTPGSVGTSFPERVIKGRKMAGRMGYERVTVKNLKVVKVDAENNLLAVKGAVPGRRGTLLEIRG